MAITCPKCGSQFGHRVRCDCGAEIEYPGTELRAGHVATQGEHEAISHEDRCVGCLLGTACGDILGAAVEGWPASAIHREFGKLHDFLGSDRGFGCYTDDTEMTLALASSLAECGRVDAAHVSAKYAEFYEPWRGYGGAAHAAMQALRSAADYRTTGREQFREGSFGNGGAMRIAPVGLAYRHAAPEVLHHAVEEALLCTHVHPEAIDAAFIQALSVARAATSSDPAKFDAKGLLQALRQQSRTEILRLKLNALSDALPGKLATRK